MTSQGWMMIGTSSVSSGSTLTCLINLDHGGFRSGPRFASCQGLRSILAGARPTNLATEQTYHSELDSMTAPLLSVPFFHVMLLRAPFPCRLQLLLCGLFFPSHGKLHLMCPTVFHGILPRHPPLIIPHQLTILLIASYRLYFSSHTLVILRGWVPFARLGLSVCNTLVA